FGSWSIRYSPDGEHLLTAGFDNRAAVWDADTGEHVFDLRGYNLPVRVAEFSPDGQLIVAGGSGGIRSFRARTGELVTVALSEQGELHALDFHPDGHTFAMGGDAADVRQWNSAHVTGSVDLIGHYRLVFESVVNTNGRLVYSVAQDGSLRSWDAMTGAQRWVQFEDSAGFSSIDLTPDDRILMTTSGDGWLRAWNAATGSRLWSRKTGGRVRNLIISPDGSFCVAGAPAEDLPATFEGAIFGIWDVQTGESLQTIEGHDGGMRRMAFTSDGTRVATTSNDGTVRLWYVPDGTNAGVLHAPGESTPNAVTFTHDDSMLIVGHADGLLAVWDVEKETMAWSRAAHNSTIGSVQLTDDGTRILTSAWHNPEVRLWHIDSGELLLELDSETTGLSDAIFLPNDAGIVTSGMEGKLRIWELSPPVSAQPIRSATLVSASQRHRDKLDAIEGIETNSKLAVAAREEQRPLDAMAILDDTDQYLDVLPEQHPLHGKIDRERAWTQPLIDVDESPVMLEADERVVYTGTYGPVQIRDSDGILVLSHDDLAGDQSLLPLGDHRFQSLAMDWIRVRFEFDGHPMACRIVGEYLTGTPTQHERTPAPPDPG
ncbi:MAG: WD40 repeat domain-containing protein, partial [Planctomycetota bacterium]